MSRSCRPTFSNASRHVCRSSRECSLVTIVRTRALSRATVGKTTDVAKIPSSNRPAANACAFDASPAMTGVIGVSLMPVSKPSACSPALKKRVLSHSRQSR